MRTIKGTASLVGFIAIALAFVMISWSVLALTEGHYYGTIGIALNWPILGLGIAILLVKFGHAKVLRPPFVYFYAGFFALMFARTMGWLP